MLFSAIRAKGGFNNNPTVSQFEAAYKSIIVHSEIKSSSSANCMALDDTTILRVSSSNIKVKDTQSELLDLLCVAGTDDLEYDNLLSVYQHSNFINDVVACFAGFINIGTEEEKQLLMRQLQISTGKSICPILRKFAMTLHFYSPSAYSYVRTIFSKALPDVSTIRKWYSKLDGLPGMTKESFQATSLKVKEMKVNGKQLYGCLVMDEMSIKQHVHWTGTRHQGYIDFGLGGKTEEMDNLPYAKDAFVIMVVDINTSWKVPIAYYLKNGISAEEKANIILNCLQELDTTGVIIKTLTFDGAANNLSMASELEANLQYSELKPYFLHPNTNDEKLPWRLEDINESGLHSATKLRNRHIYYFREKMKVRLAVQTFSTSVANAILFCMNDLKLDNFQGADATIEFCLSINNIFDILNTRNFLSKGTYNKSINKRTKTEIFHYIEESIDYLAGGFNALKNQQNVDHIEMLFSAIRAKGGFNNNPTVSQFEAAYKSIIVHSEIKSSSSANCMALDDTTILTVSSCNIKVKDTQIQILIIRNQDEVWKTITESYNQLQTSDFTSISAVKNHSYTPVSTDDQYIGIFDENSPLEFSYLGPYDTNSVTEAITTQPKPHTFYEVENDQQHTSYENITSEKQLIPKLIETSMPQKKLPKLLIHIFLRTTVGALSSSPLASLEVECACLPIELRSRRLAGKFLLKMLSSPNQSLFHMFVSIKSSWSYVPKTLPIFASVASSFSAFSPLVHRPSLRLQIYDTPYAALLYVPEVTVSPNFLGYSPKELPRLSRTLVDSLFNEYISYNFRSSVQIFTDGSVSPNSAGFSFFIPSLNFSFSDKLHPLTSSFSAECYAIISALQFIFTLDFSSFLILSDSQSCLLAISSDSFLSSLSPLVLIIKSLVYRISLADKTVKFFWIPSHVGIAGNERADYLAFSTKSLIYFSPYKTPASDLLPFHRKLLRNAWQTKWDSLPPNHAAWHRQIVTSIPKHPWFKDLEISRHLIVSYTRLRIGHSLLPHHSSKLNLNSSPLCTLHHNESICNFEHIIFDCPSLFNNRQLLFSYLSSFGYISPDSNLLLNSRVIPIIRSLIQFFHTAGFLI
ncbi:hypothetical protein QTP88_000170 [Uroleucon formosanum]